MVQVVGFHQDTRFAWLKITNINTTPISRKNQYYYQLKNSTMKTNNIKPKKQLPTSSILNINKIWLDSALRKLSPKIFQSEAQLQFELAWNIKQNFNCNVFLEDLTAYETDSKGNITHKLYTDIVVEDIETNYRIGIELKYKTAELKYNNIYLFNHGALPLNRYDYLWDVNRLESLVYNKPLYNNATSTTIVKPCDVGFAIILTNEKIIG